jgi:predicted nucleic acid-binding protein
VADAWVVNASPLIALGHAGMLDLLEQLPSELIVPVAVAEEILAGPEDPAHRAMASGWGPRRSTTVPASVAEWSLGKGESAVLSLALDVGATAVLDDRNARRCARTLGVPVIGTLGVILRAKNQGLIPAAGPVVRSVLDAGLYYDSEAVLKLLESIGESWP